MMFGYSIIAYLIAFTAILFWILSTSNLIPIIAIDRAAEIPVHWAVIKNIFLVSLFGVTHSIMARQSFKEWITKVMPKPIERSTFVLQSGLLLALLVWQWEPMGGIIWSIKDNPIAFYGLYALFFT